jgi:clan AA aspartic protease
VKGKVNAGREAVVRIQVRGRGKSSRKVNAVIDTGYTGSLSLPAATVRSLGMRRFGKRRAELADGRVVTFDVYAGSVIWNGRRIALEIDESPCDPLIGMRLLEGSELNIRVTHNGAVSIRPLP